MAEGSNQWDDRDTNAAIAAISIKRFALQEQNLVRIAGVG